MVKMVEGSLWHERKKLELDMKCTRWPDPRCEIYTMQEQVECFTAAMIHQH
jgi:hypothetical protein